MSGDVMSCAQTGIRSAEYYDIACCGHGVRRVPGKMRMFDTLLVGIMDKR
jgi:hypothetical protein